MHAIWDRGGSSNVFSAIHYNLEKFRRLNSQDNFCGKGFWGYGINYVSNGKVKRCVADIMDIEKINTIESAIVCRSTNLGLTPR